MLYDNDYYYIRVTEDQQEYELVNKDSGVVEMKSNILPKVVVTAEEYNRFLKEAMTPAVAEPVVVVPQGPNIVPIR